MSKLVPQNTLQNVITYLCFKVTTLSQTKLMKLVYLADVYHMERFGTRLTDAKFKHWYFGPYSEEVESEIEHLCQEGILKTETYQTNSGKVAEIPKPKIKQTTVNLPESALLVLDDIVNDWNTANSDEVTKYAKTCLPFVGTDFGKEINFKRIDVVVEYAREHKLDVKDAATELVEQNSHLVASLDRAKKRD